MQKPINYLPSEKTTTESSSIEFTSLLHLRWGAIIGQIILIIVVGLYLHTQIPFPIVSAIILFETGSNLLFQHLHNKKQIIQAWFFAAIMFVDVLLLTVLLSQTGGTMNPFTFLYLLHIVIGAILMPPIWSWSLTFFTIICYVSFFMKDSKVASYFMLPIAGTLPKIMCIDTEVLTHSADAEMDLHLKGMLVAFSITAFFIVYFIGKIRTALAGHNEMVAQFKEQRLQNEKLTSLATLAAGAAHEFSTPLSTIKIASGEMLYTVRTQDDNQELLEDLMLIRSQIERCEEILNQMSEDAGDHRGANYVQFTINELAEDILSMLPENSTNQITLELPTESITLHAPLQTLSRTIKGIVKNAIDASQDTDKQIILKISQNNEYIIIEVSDRGTGMDSKILSRATEPFFTTKAPGEGMGLGLFLAKSVAERFGGNMLIQSDCNSGTIVTFTLAHSKVFR